ncbi:MAG: class I SAM-dependent methyltransferase [Acidobacteriota bacterium]|nr:class I SAM-dependent methyltransferase [Acidobacteriota bacterium]
MDRLLELTALAERSHFWFRGFRWFITPLLARAVAGRPRGRILDCGCGTGSNLGMLEPLGEVYGFDLTWRGLAFAHEHGRRRLAQASIGSIPFQNASFDLVTSFDVFQCLPEAVEQSAAREMARVLKPGGAAVFNFAALDVLRGSHSVLAEEVRRYSPARVRRLLETAGLQIERLTFDFASLFPLMLAARVGHRWRRQGGEAELGEWEIQVPWAPINGALSLAVAAEAMALRVIDMPIGSSLMCLARKPSQPA